MPKKEPNGNQKLFTQAMAEKYFTAIKNDLENFSDRFDSLLTRLDNRFEDLSFNLENRLDTRFLKLSANLENRFDQRDKKLDLALANINLGQVESKEVKMKLWEHERRILKLEHKTA